MCALKYTEKQIGRLSFMWWHPTTKSYPPPTYGEHGHWKHWQFSFGSLWLGWAPKGG